MADATKMDRRTMICQGCTWAVAGLMASGCVVGGGGGDGADDTGLGTGDPLDTGSGTVGSPECEVVAQPGAAGWVELSLGQFPELDAVGGWVQTSVGGRTLNVAQVADDCFVAMETSCTHEGGRVDYRPERGQFVCTLHGAVFVNDGEPVSGPTSVPLVTYPAARVGDSVWVAVG